jgi:kumamolisin
MTASNNVGPRRTRHSLKSSSALAAAVAFAAFLSSLPANAEPLVQLSVRQPIIQPGARLLGPISRETNLSVAISLPLRDEPQLMALIQDMSVPGSSVYHHFLTPSQFTARFSPTQADYDAVAAYAESEGLSVAATTSNRLVLDVSGPATAVESAFNVHLNSYARADGTTFHEPDGVAKVPASIAPDILSVVGLSDQYKVHPNYIRADPGARDNAVRTNYSGHFGYLAPIDIANAYSMNDVTFNGVHSTLAVAEFSGFVKDDVKTYDKYYHLPVVPLPVVLVDGATNTPDGSGGDVEVDLDLEMQSAVAPDATEIYVYIAPNTATGIVDNYDRIATDNLAAEVSTSWGDWEDLSGVESIADSEYPIFQEMAAQGQTVVAATGDYGAYDPVNDPETVAVQDPASQPYVTGVGGTTLSTNSDGSYSSETVWWDGYHGSGGGVSSYWAIPSWQTTVIPIAFGWGSFTNRNVPDVCLNADPNVGYDVYNSTSDGGWDPVGGTSAAAPIWSAMIADAYQERKALVEGRVGFLNPFVYGLLAEGYYDIDMHDVTTGNNGVYDADTYYDCATGLGSYTGDEIMYELAQTPTQRAIPFPPASVTATALSHTSVKVTWTKSIGATSYIVYRYPDSHNPPQIAILPGGLHYTDNTVVHGTEYVYEIKAVNSAGYADGYASASVTP